MARGDNRTNPVVLRQGMSIGTGNAESDDEFLFSCFVDYPAVDQCVRLSSPGRIIAGRTGSGKTAIIRRIEQIADHHSVVDPAEMSMSYVSNSDALRFLDAVGADLDLLFQVLWKHILCLEFIRLRWDVHNEQKSKNIFERLIEPFSRDDRKKKAISYLRNWEGKFWITSDQNVKELTENVEQKLHGEFGADIQKFKAGGQYDKRLSSEKKSEIVARSRNIISGEQLSELHGVIDILAENVSDDYQKFYLLIDGLDDRWVDDSVRFKMIRALLASIKTFNKIRNLKILVSLRSDILERVVQETHDLTFQREKFEDFFVKIKWSKNDLFSLIEKRINLLFRRQYTAKLIGFYDIFTSKVSDKDPFDYLLERTLMRPRDIIAFVNECISISDGLYEITSRHVKRAEIEYARKRRDALEQEWRSSFPTIGKLLTFVGSAKRSSMQLSELIESKDLEDLAISITIDGKKDFDPIYDAVQTYLEKGQSASEQLVAVICSTLYRVGAVGLKLDAEHQYIYAHLDEPLIMPELLHQNVKVRVHPMLQGAFRLQDSD